MGRGFEVYLFDAEAQRRKDAERKTVRKVRNWPRMNTDDTDQAEGFHAGARRRGKEGRGLDFVWIGSILQVTAGIFSSGLVVLNAGALRHANTQWLHSACFRFSSWPFLASRGLH